VSRSARFVQNTLILVFMIGFAICVAAIVVAYVRGAIYADMLKDIVVQLLAIYSMPLGAILGGVFAQRGSGDVPAPAQAFWVAASAFLVAGALAFYFAKKEPA
jgi:hypothetical protein